MSRRLPPLNALRAFEAAARHLSFTRAAEELHVTQTAISHQIRGLEEHLGIRLFRRFARGLVLTEEAQLFLPPVRDAFEQIAGATARLAKEQTGGVLTVSILPSFAAKWLVPRIGRFRTAHPEIDLRISASTALVDFARDDVDVAIRCGPGHYPGLRIDRLFGETIAPVCSPELRMRPPGLSVPDDLRHHTLLHDHDDVDGWRVWLELAGVAGVDPSRGPGFDDASMMLQAAIDGQGVALGRSALVAADIAAGRLIRPFEQSRPFRFAYWLVCPLASADRPKIAAFRGWILEEADVLRASLPPTGLDPPTTAP